MILVSATFFDKLIAALWAAAEFMVFPVGALVLAFFLLSRLTPQLKETWNAAKPKHPLRVILIAFCVVSVSVYVLGEIGLASARKRFQEEYALIYSGEALGRVEVWAYDEEAQEALEKMHPLTPEEQTGFLEALRQIEYVGCGMSYFQLPGGRYTYYASFYPSGDNYETLAYFSFTTGDAYSYGSYFKPHFGNTGAVIAYMENLFGVSE